MLQKIFFIVNLLCITYSFVPQVKAENITANLETIKPKRPQVAQQVQLKVSYILYNNQTVHSYTSTDSDNIQFISISYINSVQMNNRLIANIKVTLRPLVTGLLKIPPITDSSGNKIFIPNIYVKSLISADKTTPVLQHGRIPWFTLIHFIVFISIVFIFISISLRSSKTIFTQIKKRYYLNANKHNAKQCISMAKKLLNTMNKMSTPKFKQQPLNTKASYTQILFIIRKRIRFLYAQKNLSFTHKELEHIIINILSYNTCEPEFIKKIHMLFETANAALYGNMQQDITTRIEHCHLLLEIMKKSYNFEQKQLHNPTTKLHSTEVFHV